MLRITDPFQHATATAARQYGAVAHEQARASGLTGHQITRLVRTGIWRRVVRGVSVVAGSPDTPQQRLMVAYLATRRAGGIVSHMSAAAELGLMPYPLLPHVTVPPKASDGCRAATIHRSVVPLIDRAHRGPLILTSVSRTIVDVAGVVNRPMLEELVDVAFCRKLATKATVESAADRIGRGRLGIDLARQSVAAWTPDITPDSPAEMRALRRLAEVGFGTLVTQYEVVDPSGAFVARLDLAAPARRRGFEYDSVQFHGPRQWGRDEARYRRLRALGWEVEPITKLDLLPGEPRLGDIAARWGVAAAS